MLYKHAVQCLILLSFIAAIPKHGQSAGNAPSAAPDEKNTTGTTSTQNGPKYHMFQIGASHFSIVNEYLAGYLNPVEGSVEP